MEGEVVKFCSGVRGGCCGEGDFGSEGRVLW